MEKYSDKFMNERISFDQMAVVDLHIHVERNFSKELLINVLKEAESIGVSALSLVMHNDIFPYLKESPLMEMIKSGEISKYYSGKIVTGVELDCRIDGAQNYSSDGRDYNGDIVHILMYDFDINKITAPGAFFNEEIRKKNWLDDMAILRNEMAKKGFYLPKNFEFVYGSPYQDQLFALLMARGNEQLKKDFQEKLGVDNSFFGKETDTYPRRKSTFSRGLTGSKDGIISRMINHQQKTLLKVEDAVALANECDGKLVLAHPAHMNSSAYITRDYMETMLRNYGKYLYGIEMVYGLDTSDDKEEIFKSFYNINRNGEFSHLRATGGSEYLTFKKKYVTSKAKNGRPRCRIEGFKFSQEKGFFPQYAGRKVTAFLGGSSRIMVPKTAIEEFNGIYSGNVDEKSI